MKKLAASILFVCCLPAAKLYAQNGAAASASQNIQLSLAPVISLKFTNTNSASGNMVGMSFNNVNQLSNGIISPTQELSVTSNKSFKISVQTDASSFFYEGSAQPTNAMPVDNTLFVSVQGNNTGGDVVSGFDNSYHSLNAASQDLVLNAQQGGDQKLTLAYKAKPGLSYPAGNYSVGVIYTATQP